MISRAYSENPRTLCDLVASKQRGLISREQAIACGMTKNSIYHATETGRWVRSFPGVFRLAAVPVTWVQQLQGAVMWAGEGAVASFGSAGALFGLDNFQPGPLEISVARSLKADLPVTVHRVKRFGIADRTVYRGIPVTSAPRLVIDLAGSFELPRLIRVVDDCLRRGFLTVTRLRWQVEQSAGSTGIPQLRRVLENPIVGVTALERKMIELVEFADLPAPVMQLPIKESAKLVGRVDFAYPDKNLVIETDGRWFHFGDERFEEDRQRRNALESRGWRVLNFTWRDLIERPEQVVADVARALAL